jgi:hypothetical protein
MSYMDDVLKIFHFTKMLVDLILNLIHQIRNVAPVTAHRALKDRILLTSLMASYRASS